MLKKEIRFVNFEDELVVETHRFHLGRAEIITLETKYPGGLEGFIDRITAANDLKTLMAEFKDIILESHGIMVDANTFQKTPESKAAFENSLAFDTLFMELCTNEESAAQFFEGIIPKQMKQEVDALIAQRQQTEQTPTPGLPPLPSS